MRITICLAVVFLAAGSALAQSDVLAPGDNLVMQGIPKIPMELAEMVSRYTNSRSALLEDWHPTRREMLIGTRFGDTVQTHLVKFPLGERTQLTFFPDPVMGSSFQPKTGDQFLFTKAAGGNEFFQKYLYDFKTGDIRLVTDGKSRNTGGVWSNAGDRIAYGSTRRTKQDVDLYISAPAEPSSDKLLAELTGGGWMALDWSPDDAKILAGEYVSINESYLWLIDVAGGAKTPITPKSGSEKIAYPWAKFSKDGKGLYVTTDRESEFLRLAYVDLATKQHTYLTTGIPWDVEHFDLTSDGKKIAFVVNEEGVGKLHLLDTATGMEMPVPELPPGSVQSVLWHKNGNDLGFDLVSARSPADAYSLDVQTGKVEHWTHSETGGLPTTDFRE
jgi:Tol biopolymer transport system component